MMGGVVVHNIRSLSMMPSLGAMIGSTHSSEVLERLNMASGGGVIFGQPGDPIRDRYQALKTVLMDNLSLADTAVTQIRETVVHPDRMVPITSVEAVQNIPPCMKLPFVMYDPIRTLLQDGRIDGFGIDPRFLLEEDVYGRLINNGKVDISAGDKEFIWLWRTDDPKVTEEDLEAVEATRGWIDRWLLKEMQPGGTYRDPTDPSNKISKKKKK